MNTWVMAVVIRKYVQCIWTNELHLEIVVEFSILGFLASRRESETCKT